MDARGRADLYGVVVVDGGAVLLEGTKLHGAVFATGTVDFGSNGEVLFSRSDSQVGHRQVARAVAAGAGEQEGEYPVINAGHYAGGARPPAPPGILTPMEKRPRITGRFVAWTRRLQRTRLECRECEVICERVISPQHCLDSGCSSVYVYEDDDTKMFGCLHKVFSSELDLAAFSQRPGRRSRLRHLGRVAVESRAAPAVQGHGRAGLSGGGRHGHV